MKRDKSTVFIITITLLATCLMVALGVVALLYNTLTSYPTPEVSYANARNTAVKECEKSSRGISEPCTNLQLDSMSKIDVGNDIAGTDYVFKPLTLSNGISYSVWVDYDGDIYSADTLRSN